MAIGRSRHVGRLQSKLFDHYTFLGNCPPTPPLSKHFDHYTFLGDCPPTLPLGQPFALIEVSIDVGLGEEWVGSFHETYNDPIVQMLAQNSK